MYKKRFNLTRLSAAALLSSYSFCSNSYSVEFNQSAVDHAKTGVSIAKTLFSCLMSTSEEISKISPSVKVPMERVKIVLDKIHPVVGTAEKIVGTFDKHKDSISLIKGLMDIDNSNVHTADIVAKLPTSVQNIAVLSNHDLLKLEKKGVPELSYLRLDEDNIADLHLSKKATKDVYKMINDHNKHVDEALKEIYKLPG